MTSVRLNLGAAQPPEHVSISTPAMLVVLVLVLVTIAAYKDEKLAAALAAACAVGMLILAVLVV